jgi:hypothetical protein
MRKIYYSKTAAGRERREVHITLLNGFSSGVVWTFSLSANKEGGVRSGFGCLEK